MKTADRRKWQAARTLPGLGELTAQWLEGRIASVPGYDSEPAFETMPLTRVLASLNRAGFVTIGSQPGMARTGHDGEFWEQRAAVEGFADPLLLARLAAAAHHAGLAVIAHDPAKLPRRRYRYGAALTVTRRAGRPVTDFGIQLPRRHIRDADTGYGICHRDAVNALCSAWQVTLTDPVWGREDVLWNALAAVARPASGMLS